ncbi:unnamed protein product [Bursaphelenchus okinawaensis]|uniref:Reverse transcriptase domain-containing protein n=1 Tax=Bursaphelenchus okinawaensis TaxID=465554 RepID=A0A811L5S0_9BILA|nr:unnamed protein product [Bursaphelenchus okinawaensis]CAG9117950.1 unnamed protein product [Bursaphelenchus okinawaensis]
MPKRENTSLSKVKKNASLKKVEKNASRLTVEKNTSLSKVEKNASRLPVEKSRSAVENSSLKKVERDIATKYGKMQTKLSDLITEFMVSIEGLNSERRKLPPVHDIPHFSGEADTFPEFWDYWKYHVHDVDAPVTDKLTSLKAVLKNGSAYSIVKNRRLTVADYNAVIQILHSQYGDSQEIISSWFDKLYNLEPPKEIEANQISDYANTLLSIKSQLDYYNTSIPGFMMLKIAKSLPLSLSEMVDLRCLYKHGSPYNMDDLVEALKNVAKKVQNVKVPLPFKDNSVDIENEFKRCFGRLHHIVQTLDKKPNLKTAYDKNFTDYLKLGIIEECEFHRSTDKTVRYIPHLPVERPGHPTTPVRNVFDGSAKDKNGISLNSCLNQGFTLLPEIPDIIIKSRKFKYLGIADLEKAFLMVEILEKYRDSVRFLWLKDITKPVTYSNIKIFRFKRVTFRLICSPSLLATVIHLHLSKYVEKIGTKSLKDILSMLYVDNLFLGSNDEEVLTKQALDLKSIFAEGAMNLREYSSNSKKLIDSFQEADIATRKILFLL